MEQSKKQSNGIGSGALKKTKQKCHCCRLCSRRFACGRALGGHMRAHASEATAYASASSSSSSAPHVQVFVASPPASPTDEDSAAAWALVWLSRDHWPAPHVPAAGETDEAAHPCPFCGRVFASGQALGGHKKFHRFDLI